MHPTLLSLNVECRIDVNKGMKLLDLLGRDANDAFGNCLYVQTSGRVKNFQILEIYISKINEARNGGKFVTWLISSELLHRMTSSDLLPAIHVEYLLRWSSGEMFGLKIF